MVKPTDVAAPAPAAAAATAAAAAEVVVAPPKMAQIASPEDVTASRDDVLSSEDEKLESLDSGGGGSGDHRDDEVVAAVSVEAPASGLGPASVEAPAVVIPAAPTVVVTKDVSGNEADKVDDVSKLPEE